MYCGTVTDLSWHIAVIRLPSKRRADHLFVYIDNIKIEKGFDFLYSIGRLPRIYWDEINWIKKGNI